MGDVISWSKLNKLNKKSDSIKVGVEATGSNVDFLIDGVQQVKTDLKDNKETIETMNTKMDKMVEDVHNEIQADPTGVPAPHMAVFNLSSTKDGIKVDYTVNVGIAQNGQIPSTSGNYNYSLASVTKGVMVRYSDTHYPTNREDGELAFIDTDVLTTQSNGQLSAKAKSQVVTGKMVMNNTYYFSAFPYSNYNVYNEQLGTFNCKQAQYIGDVGIVEVDVSANVIVKPFGAYTLTLTGGGNTYTKQGNGNEKILFTAVKPATYNLTITPISGYKKPQQQTVTLAGGQTKQVTMEYKIDIAFATASWADIDLVSKSGKANQVFKIGDTKDLKFASNHWTFGTPVVTLQIVDFNHDDLQKGGKAGISIAMKNLFKDTYRANSGNTRSFLQSDMGSVLNQNTINDLPQDLKKVIKPVIKKTHGGGGSDTIVSEVVKLWTFSEIEVFGTIKYSQAGEGYKYPIFTTNSSRIKYLNNGNGESSKWWLRSPNGVLDQVCVWFGGDSLYESCTKSLGICWGFCI